MGRIHDVLSEKSRWYVEKNRYLELVYFCRQYDRWRKLGDTEKVGIIEEAAKEADPEIWEWLISGVCREEKWEHMSLVRNAPFGRDLYYDRRRRMIFYLDKLRN